MAVLNRYSIKNNGIDNETQTSAQEELLMIKHQYSAGILKSLDKPAVGKLSEKELNSVVQELWPGPAESTLMRS